MQKKSVIIVGAGQSAAVCAIELRGLGFEGQILIIGDEKHMPYERPELSKKLVLGEKSLAEVTILNAEKAAEKDIQILTDNPVTEIDRTAKTVNTREAVYSYDYLVFATGGRARVLPQAEETGLPVVSVRTIEDSERLKMLMASGRSVAVIGGGWLGLEAAATCRKAGLDATLLEAADRLCARVAPEQLSADLLELHQGYGVRVLLGETVTFERGGLTTAAGLSLRPDFLVTAIGMEANDAIAANAGLETDRGIMVDQDFRTSDPAVFAIGDCAAVRQPGGSARRMESWQNANQSAARVAAVIAGHQPQTGAPNWFWSDQFGNNIQMIGDLDAPASEVVNPNGDGKVVFYTSGDILRGAYAINAPREIMKCRRKLQASNTLCT